MRMLRDPAGRLAAGLAAIREEFGVPGEFPAEVAALAREAGRAPDGHVDWTDRAFVTLDPASATDLDQAFAIERAGSDLLLHYAIADVGWFVDDGGPVDAEAWRRGTTCYLPGDKAPLYPPVLSEAAASLLPAGPRPAVVFMLRVGAGGDGRLDAVTRAMVRNRAKLAYDDVRPADLPDGFIELTDRLDAAERRRGAARVDPPEQEVAIGADGSMVLRFRPRTEAEARNAAMSLAVNIAVAQMLLDHRTGLFRIMSEPDEAAVARLRATAAALGVAWPADETLDMMERRLDAHRPGDAALMLAIRRAGRGAAYAPWREGMTGWHAAVAAPYAHATAPLRRLADRYVIETALALANDRPPPFDAARFAALAPVMNRADGRDGRIDAAVFDLAEAILLEGREGETFRAMVTDSDGRGIRIQIAEPAVTARIATALARPGDEVMVRLVEADPARRSIRFDTIG